MLINRNNYSESSFFLVSFWIPLCLEEGRFCPTELLQMSIAAASQTHSIPLQMLPEVHPFSPIFWWDCIKIIKKKKKILITCNTYKSGKLVVNLHCHFHLTKTEKHEMWYIYFFPILKCSCLSMIGIYC